MQTLLSNSISFVVVLLLLCGLFCCSPVQGASRFSVEELNEEPLFKGLDGVYQSSWQRYNTGRIGLKVQKSVEMVDSKEAMALLVAACTSSDKAATCTEIIRRIKADYQTMVGSVGALFKLLDPHLEKVELDNLKKKKKLSNTAQQNKKPAAAAGEKALQKETKFTIELEKEKK